MSEKYQDQSDASLTKNLREFYKNQYPNFCDLSIKCADGQVVEAHKLILVLKSEYFSALFRQQPTLSELNLPQYEAPLIRVIIKSLVEINCEELEKHGLVEVLRAADYFQIKDLVDIISDLIAENISEENLLDVLELTETVHSPSLENGCVSLIKENLEKFIKDGLVIKLSKKILLKLFSKPWPRLFDKYGRQYAILETTEILLSMLYETLKAIFNFIKMAPFYFQ